MNRPDFNRMILVGVIAAVSLGGIKSIVDEMKPEPSVAGLTQPGQQPTKDPTIVSAESTIDAALAFKPTTLPTDTIVPTPTETPTPSATATETPIPTATCVSYPCLRFVPETPTAKPSPPFSSTDTPTPIETIVS